MYIFFMTQNLKRALVFDLDGTLIPTMETYADIAADTIQEHLKMKWSDARAAYIQTSGLPFEKQLYEIFPNITENIHAKTVNDFETKKALYFKDQNFPLDVLNCLKFLKSKNYLIIISSNNFQTLVDEIIDRTNFTFDLALGYKKNFSKGLDHFLYIEKKFNINHTSITFIGDSIKDLEKALHYRSDFIGIEGIFQTHHFKKIDPNVKVVNTFERIKDFL